MTKTLTALISGTGLLTIPALVPYVAGPIQSGYSVVYVLLTGAVADERVDSLCECRQLTVSADCSRVVVANPGSQQADLSQIIHSHTHSHSAQLGKRHSQGLQTQTTCP